LTLQTGLLVYPPAAISKQFDRGERGTG